MIECLWITCELYSPIVENIMSYMLYANDLYNHSKYYYLRKKLCQCQQLFWLCYDMYDHEIIHEDKK